ncbi:gamma-glutamylcyclotransferase-like [Glandiceps talaboti]
MGTFLYFGYASNLHLKRIQLSCPTAKFRTIAKLPGYKFVFQDAPNFDSYWCGATANIIQSSDDITWGSVWEIENQYIDALNKQDAVDKGIYRSISITVITPTGEEVECRCLEMCCPPQHEGLPSPQYLSVIVDGAIQIGLPTEYIQMLKRKPHNGFDGKVEIMEDIKKGIESK